MAIDDKLTDLMAARLSKGEDLDLIYTNPLFELRLRL